MAERTPKLNSRAIIGWFYSKLRLAEKNELVAALAGEPVPSDQAEEEYGWLGMVPGMREWIGPRHIKTLQEYEYKIKNRKFESTLEILLDDWRRNKTEQYRVRTREMATRAGGSHWLSLVCSLILNGETGLCYDGQYFFDTTHNEGDSGDQANYREIDISALPTSVHGDVTAPSPGEVAQCINHAIAGLYGLLDDQGNPYNETATEFKVVAGTNLQPAIDAALSNQFLASGESNPMLTAKKNYTITSDYSPRLNALTDSFDVYRTDADVKPFIIQNEVDVTTTMQAEGSQIEAEEDKWRFYVMCLRNAGYGLWQLGYRVRMI